MKCSPHVHTGRLSKVDGRAKRNARGASEVGASPGVDATHGAGKAGTTPGESACGTTHGTGVDEVSALDTEGIMAMAPCGSIVVVHGLTSTEGDQVPTGGGGPM
jgi:hypothetical protein